MPTEPKLWKLLPLSLFVAFTSPSWALAETFQIIAPAESFLEVTEAGIRAELSHDGCSTGHDAACTVVLQRSEYVSTHSHNSGDSVAYSWGILVPQDFTYNATGEYLRAVRLLNGSGELLLSFILDRESGYSVGGQTCFGPEDFGEWHMVEVRVAWDSTRRNGLKDKTPGNLLVICDGAEVLSRSGRPNISAEEEVWIAVGLAGSLRLADGDNTEVSFRNVSIETW